jgi:hypothetical protein
LGYKNSKVNEINGPACQMVTYMRSEFQKYFESPYVKEAFHNYNILWNRNKKLPYINYFGINFDSSNIISFKIYFHTFNKLTEEEILWFLPTASDFLKYYPLALRADSCAAEHTGIAFAIKFNSSSPVPHTGFHFQLSPSDESYALVGMPENLPFDISTVKITPGINYEYDERHVLRKRYYYFDTKEHKAYFAARFGFDFLNRVKYIEYTESEKFSKINAWGHCPENNDMLNIFLPWQNEVINELCNEFEIKNTVFGYYENSDIRSTYFIRINTRNDLYPKISYRNTLELIYQSLL